MCRSALMFLLDPKAITTLVENPSIMHSHYAKGSWNHQNNSRFVPVSTLICRKWDVRRYYPLMSKSKLQKLHHLTAVRKQGHCILITLFCLTPFLISVVLHTLADVVLKGHLQWWTETFFSWQTVGSLLLPPSGHSPGVLYIERVAYGAQDLPDEKNVIK